jgi:hypothetical protein
MRKLILFLLICISAKVNAQVYQEMPQYGYRANRMAFDSTLQIPSVCGVPTLKSNVTKKSAIAYDTCNAKFYVYNSKTLTWSELSGGGGGSTDTTSLSNRINLKLSIADTSAMLNPYLRKIDTSNKFVNSIIRTEGKDSIIYFVGANRFAIKDSVGTNPAPVGYYGAFQDTTTQTAALINTAYAVKLGVTDLSNGVTISNNTRIKIANAGIYNIQFSLQLEKTGGSGNMIADIWLRKNGVNLDGTTGKVVLTGSANASPVVAAWNYVISVTSNDSLELMWATSNDNVIIKSAVATSPHPSIPSAILTVTQQSGIMAGTGINPLDTANMLNPYARTNFVNSSLSTKLNATDTASLSNRINLKLNASDTASLSNRIETKLTNLDLLQLMSYGIKAESYGITLANMSSQQSLTSNRFYLYPFNWNVSDSIRGVAWFNRAAFTNVATNYNGIAIYSLSGGTLNRVLFSTNDGTFWNSTINSWTVKTLTTTYLTKGIYFIGYQFSGSGTPTIGSGAPLVIAGTQSPSDPPNTSIINNNGVKFSTFIANATATPPTSIAMSTTTAVVNIPYFLFY